MMLCRRCIGKSDEPDRHCGWELGHVIANAPTDLLAGNTKTVEAIEKCRLLGFWDGGTDKERTAELRCFPLIIYLSKESVMLGWVLTFLVIAIVAGVLGFGGVATASAGIAQTIFYIFLVLVLVSLVYHLLKGRGSI
jgi:uncharacterized membrane protein YtjA (UPF0391 family)